MCKNFPTTNIKYYNKIKIYLLKENFNDFRTTLVIYKKKNILIYRRHKAHDVDEEYLVLLTLFLDVFRMYAKVEPDSQADDHLTEYHPF